LHFLHAYVIFSIYILCASFPCCCSHACRRNSNACETQELLIVARTRFRWRISLQRLWSPLMEANTSCICFGTGMRRLAKISKSKGRTWLPSGALPSRRIAHSKCLVVLRDSFWWPYCSPNGSWTYYYITFIYPYQPEIHGSPQKKTIELNTVTYSETFSSYVLSWFEGWTTRVVPKLLGAAGCICDIPHYVIGPNCHCYIEFHHDTNCGLTIILSDNYIWHSFCFCSSHSVQPAVTPSFWSSNLTGFLAVGAALPHKALTVSACLFFLLWPCENKPHYLWSQSDRVSFWFSNASSIRVSFTLRSGVWESLATA